LRVYGHRVHWVLLVARPALAAGGFAFVLWVGRDLPLLVESLLGSGAFVVATLLLRIWDQKEIDLVRRFLGRPR